MATDLTTQLVTAEEFLVFERSAPEGSHFELIEGQIREYAGDLCRSPQHSQVTPRISREILNWLDDHPDLPGTVADGEARCKILRDPETIVGLDVGYFEGEQHIHQPGGQSWFEGPPVVAVEVLSNSDTHEKVSERIQLFLRAGVRQVWIADPVFHTITVYRTDAEPVLFSEDEELPGEPELPGFRCQVRRLFPGRPRRDVPRE